MDLINAGDVVSIRHYSGTNPFKSIVTEVENDILTVKLSKDFAIFNFFEEDPIVLGFETNSEIYTSGCSIISVSARMGIIKLKVNYIEAIANKRVSERFPVSVYADIKVSGSQKKHTAIVKDLSLSGLKVSSKVDFSIGDKVDINLYTNNTVILIAASIVWKTESKNCLEYGLEIVDMDYQNQTLIKQYLKLLKKEQEDFIRNLNY